MESSRRSLIVAALGAWCVATWTTPHLPGQRQTPVVVTRLYTGPDGQTHAEKIEVKFNPRPEAGLLGEQAEMVRAAGAQFSRYPPGWVRDWHPAPSRQYVVALSGQAEIEVAGGQKFRVEPGQVGLAEDVTGKGHITRILGSEDWVILAVPLAVFGQTK